MTTIGIITAKIIIKVLLEVYYSPVYTDPSVLITTTDAPTDYKGPPTLTDPLCIAATSVLAIVFSCARVAACEVAGASVEVARLGASALTTAVISTEPLLTPTILSLPVSIPKKAQIFVMNVVAPLFE